MQQHIIDTLHSMTLYVATMTLLSGIQLAGVGVGRMGKWRTGDVGCRGVFQQA